MSKKKPWEPELNAMAKCWDLIEPLPDDARARVLLWMLRKHQDVGTEVDIRALEQEAWARNQPPYVPPKDVD